ncbi:MAG: cation:proton antiporter [Runella sp.]
MTTYLLLSIICSLIVYSYLADLVAQNTKIPAVLVLLLSGIGLRFLIDYLQVKTVNFNLILPALGTIGLIMIVFEGALELDYKPHKKTMIKQAFVAALSILVLSTLLIAGIFFYFTQKPFNLCLLNAIPLTVISSAIAIPSVASLMPEQKEFIVYESSFSDILGIMFFNFVATNSTFDFNSVLHLGGETISIVLISLLSCLGLLYLLGRITKHVKFVLIIALLILIYALSRLLHLPALVIVFVFGLFLRNVDLFKNGFFEHFFLYPRYNADMEQLHQLSAESAFLLRTFFFIIFGFTIEISLLGTYEVIQYGLLVTVIMLIVRYALLRYILKRNPTPEVFITPRGLITILLFYSLTDAQHILPSMSGVLLFVVLATSLVMSYGIIRNR